MRPDTESAHRIADYCGGFIAAEGCFTILDRGRRFRFSVGLGAQDRGMCELLREVLGVGRVYWYRRRREHYDDEATFVVQSLPELVDVVVPFLDAHLPPSHKRGQYLEWRTALLDYWRDGAKRPRPCTVPGCTERRRAHGLCRRHLFEQRRL